jgi:predicted nuclease with TOPRIM domain
MSLGRRRGPSVYRYLLEEPLDEEQRIGCIDERVEEEAGVEEGTNRLEETMGRFEEKSRRIGERVGGVEERIEEVEEPIHRGEDWTLPTGAKKCAMYELRPGAEHSTCLEFELHG